MFCSMRGKTITWDNPLLSFISEMGMQLGQMDKTTGEMKKSFEKAWGFGKKIIPHVASVGTRLLLGTAVDFSGLANDDDKERKELFEQLSGAIGTSSANYAEELLAQQITTKQAVKDFKKAVRAFVKQHTKGTRKNAPMFFLCGRVGSVQAHLCR